VATGTIVGVVVVVVVALGVVVVVGSVTVVLVVVSCTAARDAPSAVRETSPTTVMLVTQYLTSQGYADAERQPRRRGMTRRAPTRRSVTPSGFVDSAIGVTTDSGSGLVLPHSGR
jgi:hypothetical protein